LSSFSDAIKANAKIGTSAAAGAGAGAAAGYAVSRIGKKNELVYQSSGTAEPAAIRKNAEAKSVLQPRFRN
jgi:hypothetical protein